MKILVMGFTKIKFMPYMNFYLENIGKENDIHILYWNRDLKDEDISGYNGHVLHEFRCYQEDDVSKFSKIGSFVKYRSYAKKLIRKECFDFIFVLHSLPGVLISDVLTKKYSGKYILDYRDSTYEGFAPFRKIVGNIVEHSSATFVSSDAFRRYLPDTCSEKIYTSHNMLMDSLLHRDEKKLNGIASDKIRIAFWGFIRHEEINRQIIKNVASDSRFELHYYGREQQVAMNLKQYVKDIGAKNIFFHGEYRPEERYEFVRSTDLIHNIYKDSNTMLAMGNKYYDGVIFKIPQLCTTGSFMGQRITECDIGLECDPSDSDFTEKIYNYYVNISFDRFEKNCDEELQRVLGEYKAGIEIIQGSISGF